MSEWKWLESTKKLQEESYGVDFDALEGDARADYFMMNVTALLVEAGEFMAEVGWKPWAEPRGWVNRHEAVKECVDIAHFLANMLTALGVSDFEWETYYTAKQALNAKRQAEGYDGVSEKCPSCHRALDDVEVRIAPNGDQYCLCGAVLKRAEKELTPTTTLNFRDTSRPFIEPAKRTLPLLESDKEGPATHIIVPCGHPAPRPPDFGGTVECGEGHRWKMTSEHGGRSWKAERVGPSR
jgi:hypothetical protein